MPQEAATNLAQSVPAAPPTGERRGPLAAVARFITAVLSESVMGCLALLAVALGLFPVLFELSRHVEWHVDLYQWWLVGLFALEYLAALWLAPRRLAFMREPWRVIDLLTVLLPLASLHPGVTDALRSSPALRLLRLARVAVVGVRFSGAVVRERGRRTVAVASGPVRVSFMRDGERLVPEPSTWSHLLMWAADPTGGEWYHVSNLSSEPLREVARAAKVPASLLESHLLGSSYPHLEVNDRYSALFVWIPTERPGPALSVERTGLLLLATGETLLTLAQRPLDLHEEVAATLGRLHVPGGGFSTRMLCAFLRAVVDRNEHLVGCFERELRALEEVPVRESRPEFLEHTFRVKRELSSARSDLWRLKGILESLAESRLRLPGSEASHCVFFRALADDADFLHETAEQIREGLISLIELHLNVVSFEMNRVMRVLAVVSVLGLVPAVCGGLLGMNLVDNPWPMTLPQVSFGVLWGMVLGLYVFYVKGWLR